VTRLAPTLLAVCGCATLTAAKIIGETADIMRFRSRHGYARHNGTAPVPVWSGNRHRHRLSRIGNRQLNAALHRIALTQAHYHPTLASSSAADASQATPSPSRSAR
jgi:transposase